MELKKIGILFVVLILLCPITVSADLFKYVYQTPQPINAAVADSIEDVQRWGYTSRTNVYVRTDPQQRASYIAIIPDIETYIWVQKSFSTDDDNIWYQIQWDENALGYIRADYLVLLSKEDSAQYTFKHYNNLSIANMPMNEIINNYASASDAKAFFPQLPSTAPSPTPSPTPAVSPSPTPTPVLTPAPSSLPASTQTYTPTLSSNFCTFCGGTGSCSHCIGGGCPYCSGTGYRNCTRCGGSGMCRSCGGIGYSGYYDSRTQSYRERNCTTCSGSGWCTACYGGGMVDCTYCSGSGMCNYCYGSGLCQYCSGTGKRN